MLIESYLKDVPFRSLSPAPLRSCSGSLEPAEFAENDSFSGLISLRKIRPTIQPLWGNPTEKTQPVESYPGSEINAKR
jgi:hypothetical protein